MIREHSCTGRLSIYPVALVGMVVLFAPGIISAQSIVRRHELAGALQSMALTRDGKKYAIAVSPLERLDVFLSATGEKTDQFNRELGHNTALAFSSTDKCLAYALLSQDEKEKVYSGVRLADLARKEPVYDLIDNDGNIGAIVFGGSDDLLATSADSGKIRIWNLKKKQLLYTLGEHVAAARLAFSPDSKTLVSSDSDRNVNLWDVGNGKLLKTLKPISSPYLDIAYSPMGKTLIGTSKTGEMHIWNTSTYTCEKIPVIEDIPSPVSAICICSDSNYVALSSGALLLLPN